MTTRGRSSSPRSPEDPDQLSLAYPDEDSGSETADRYEFQHNVAARHCCELLHTPELTYVVCEWHTDFILGYDDGSRSLVSVKHREQDQGTWTLSRLCEDGGFATLYTRWEATGRPRECRFVTNAALAREVRDLQHACSAGDLQMVQRSVGSLASKFACNHADAESFLLTLRIESDLPSRKYIRAHNIERYMRKALGSARLHHLDAWGSYDAIVGIVREASRDVADLRDATISVPGALTEQGKLDATVARRKIDIARIRATINSLPAAPSALILTPAECAPGAESTLVKKLRRGEVNETSIFAAKRLRRSWADFAARYSLPLPGADLVEDLITRVSHHAGQVVSEVKCDDRAYGEEMLRVLSERLTPQTVAPHAASYVDGMHLLGCAYQLTDECQVWWSERFDLSTGEAS